MADRAARRRQAPIPASPPRMPTAKRGSSQFDATDRPKAATGAVVVATKIFWALGYNQVRRSSPRSIPGGSSSIRRPRSGVPPVSERRSPAKDLDELLDRAQPKRRRHLSRRRWPPSAGQGPRRLSLLGHAPRRSERHRSARAPARAARAPRFRRVDEPDRPEGGQHARHARQGERPSGRQALPAGRRLDVRHGNGLHEWDIGWEHFYEGGATAKRLLLVRLCAEPVADGAVHGVPVDRQVRRRPLRSAGRGSRRRRRRPTWRCERTMRSGRRGG